jgi:hypothetical protein
MRQLRAAIERVARGDGTPSTLRSPSPSRSSPSKEEEERATTQAPEGVALGDVTSLAAANACAQLVATAATAETAARLQSLLHGDLAEQAIAALLATPRAIAGLLEAASSASTSTEARVRLLGSIAACRESGPFKELDPEAEREAVSACLSILAEPDASVELQASTRRLLRTAQLEPLREACVAAPPKRARATLRSSRTRNATPPPYSLCAALGSPNAQACAAVQVASG